MLKKDIHKYVLLITISLIKPSSILLKISTKGPTSQIEISSQTNLYIKNDINNFDGKLIKGDDSLLNCKNIEFINGKIETKNNKIELSGKITTSSNKLELNGNSAIYSKKGIIEEPIYISGQNNKIEGSILTNENIKLTDLNSTLTLIVQSNISNDIELNGGTIYLEDDICFMYNKKFIGPGNVNSQKRSVLFNGETYYFDSPICFSSGSNIKLDANIELNTTFTFLGDSRHTIDGHGKTLTFSTNGKILIDDGNTLALKNLIIENLHSENIECVSDNSKIVFQNVKLNLSDNFYFKKGYFNIKDSLEISDDHIFAYQTDQVSTIKDGSYLLLSNGVTFSYDPSTPKKNLISFETENSRLIIDNSSLHTTETGIILTKGELIVVGEANLSSESTSYETVPDLTAQEISWEQISNRKTIIDEGISLGMLSEEEDMKCTILNLSTLHVINGTLKYKNVNPNYINMNGESSILKICDQGSLKIYNDLYLEKGMTSVEGNPKIFLLDGKKLICNINSSGKINKIVFDT